MPQFPHTLRTLTTALALWGAVVFAVGAQECADTARTGRVIRRTLLFGVGSGNVLDTYLSPYSYTGTSGRVYHEMQRETRLFRSTRALVVSKLDVDCAFLKNPARNVDEYAGGLRYSFGAQCLLPVGEPFALACGPQMSAYVGGVYNERGSNNPAQAKADLMLDLAASARWRFGWLRHEWALRYSLDVPLVGAAFSMNYGQSYYEAFSLGQGDHNVVFASFFNMPSLRQTLTLEFRLGHRTQTRLRLGYGCNLMQAKLNGLRYHSYQHTLLVGFTKSFLKL